VYSLLSEVVDEANSVLRYGDCTFLTGVGDPISSAAVAVLGGGRSTLSGTSIVTPAILDVSGLGCRKVAGLESSETTSMRLTRSDLSTRSTGSRRAF